ncbi:hypothetical protein C4561_01475 [candidate division WWE3 bacterium]|uniref:Uncharacterized protein n=1 Tax=candidate division WWE3 bacterium TaxID=2053526 RepID=A0A3A4ZF34_UNCKA|nr:MAG: hypothetical protein C4561_01475 [candidate division WWE3 bacterium]
MKLLWILGLLALLISPIFAQTDQTKLEGNLYVEDSLRVPYLNASDSARIGANAKVEKDLTLGSTVDTSGAVLMYVRNKAGVVLLGGDIVEPDSTGILLGCNTKGEVDTEADSFYYDLDAEGYPVSLRFITVGTADAGDSVRVYGTVYGATSASVERRYLGTGANNEQSSSYLWSDIDSISNRGANAATLDSVRIWAWSFAGVKACITAKSRSALGVVVGDSISDNAVGRIVIKGVVQADAEPSATAVLGGVKAGEWLEINARGNLTQTIAGLAPDSIYNRGLAIALQALSAGGTGAATDSGKIWILWNGN